MARGKSAILTGTTNGFEKCPLQNTGYIHRKTEKIFLFVPLDNSEQATRHFIVLGKGRLVTLGYPRMFWHAWH